MVAVSVIIPVYHAEQTLLELSSQLALTMAKISDVYEIIFVDDGSTDQSWPLIAELSRSDQRVRGIRLSRNYGQQNALLCGIRAARYTTIITMDDDLQHPVSEIEPMLAALSPGYDVVYGIPQEVQRGFCRDIASRLIKRGLAHAMGVKVARNVSAFRVFRTRLRDGFQAYSCPFVSIDVLLSWTTVRFTAIKVRHAPRCAGLSGYTLGKLITLALNIITGFSTLPLRLASIVGFIFLLFGILVQLYVLVNYMIRGSVVPGFAFQASITAILSGAQLFGLGIIGEYLARMHLRSIGRPAYVIGEFAQSDHPDCVASEDKTAHPEMTVTPILRCEDVSLR